MFILCGIDARSAEFRSIVAPENPLSQSDDSTLSQAPTDAPEDDLDPCRPLSLDEWSDLVVRAFGRRQQDRRLALLVDLPDAHLEDNNDWHRRRTLAWQWRTELGRALEPAGLEVRLYAFANARTNNGPLPSEAWTVASDVAVLHHVDEAQGLPSLPMDEVFQSAQILMAPTELSATAPLKLGARRFGFRAATMPSFKESMIGALRLDYQEIDRRCRRLKELLDAAHGVDFHFQVGDEDHHLHLDLRRRSAHVSSGLLAQPGVAGNLPSGETYIVPYEGEDPADPSRSSGTLPVQLDGEVVLYDIEGNVAKAVRGDGPVAERERAFLASEPAYGNVAELGLGVLSAFGLEPIGEILLDEKLGLHIAFGRSDHFGGQVGPDDFSSADNVVHIDRVYLPQTQPAVKVRKVDWIDADGAASALMRDGDYVADIFSAESGEA